MNIVMNTIPNAAHVLFGFHVTSCYLRKTCLHFDDDKKYFSIYVISDPLCYICLCVHARRSAQIFFQIFRYLFCFFSTAEMTRINFHLQKRTDADIACLYSTQSDPSQRWGQQLTCLLCPSCCSTLLLHTLTYKWNKEMTALMWRRLM